MRRVNQPAKTNYFFGPGWKQLLLFIKKYWELCQQDIKIKATRVETGKGIMSFSGAWRLMSCFSLILFGTLFFAVISAGVSLLLGVAFLVVYLLVFLIWIIDRIQLVSRGIFVPCPECKNRFLIPVYKCSKCGANHTNLTPGRYGIIYRTCECGQKLPTHFITGRDNLEAECPLCGTPLSGTGTKPICVPVIGGRSSGKTAYINAFSHEFIENVAPRNGLTVKHYNDETKKFYDQEITNDYRNGTTRMTKTETDINRTSSKAFSFIVQSPKLNPDRMIQLYDVAGESFVENSENEIQLQYTYCQGVIFMLDPLSISTVRNYLDERVNEVDKSSVGTLDVDLVLDVFMNKLREITGQSSTSVFNVPIAIVISKSDIHTVNKFIGDDIISDFLSERNLDMDSYSVAEDYVCRKFLMDNGLAGFVSNVDLKFKNNRYFKCSSIGHTRETGRYNPKGVLDPMEWIMQTVDGGLKSVLHENEFGAVIRGEE